MTKYEDFLNQIQNNKFYAYGAGGHGLKFQKSLHKLGIDENLMGFAVSNNQGNTNVKKIDDIPRDTFIVICAHNQNANEMEKNLDTLGFKKYINALPYLTQLYWGQPIKSDVDIEVEIFAKKIKKINYIAALFLGVDYALGNSCMGKDIYLKTLNITSDEQTSKLRWDGFKSRIRTYYDNTEKEDYSIMIDYEKGLVLDGAHRIVLALYFKKRFIKGNLYSVDKYDYENYYKDSVYEDKNFYKHFSQEEIGEIEYIKRVILKSNYE